MGVVKAAAREAGRLRLVVAGPNWDPADGESIAVNGCCLTIAGRAAGEMQFDVVRETLDKTTLGDLRVGTRVNLERSLRAGDFLGGHLVQGHVDGVGDVSRVQDAEDYRVWVTPPSHLVKFMVPKGSVCLDGVSLTLAEVDVNRGEIGVALIPTTLRVTTASLWRAGGRVNIEADTMAKTMVNYLEHFQGR